MEPENRVMVATSASNRYTIQIHRDIDNPESFSQELAAIASAGEGDEIIIDICTDGGCVHTALLIAKALQKTPAVTCAVIGPNCCSAGTVIALACDRFELDEHSMFMIHAATFGIFGKHHEVKGQYAFKLKWLENMMNSVYAGFLNEQEIERVVSGADMWMLSDELAERLTYYNEYRDAIAEQPVDEEAA